MRFGRLLGLAFVLASCRGPSTQPIAVACRADQRLALVGTVRGLRAGTAELEALVAPMVEALRSLGGTADQAAIGTSVVCRRTSERPRSEPLGEGSPDQEIR